MAGDWIKLEHATATKPEVVRMAEILGVNRREMMGILFDFWVWLDQQSRNATVTLMSRKSLDDVLHCAGLAACLETVGWVEWDDKSCVMIVKNYDRHNGKPAKSRALGKERASRKRNGTNVTDALPEKRRVLHINKGLDAPTDEHRKQARELGLNCDDQFQRYRDWQASTGKKHKDETAGFRNWLRNAKGMGPAKPIPGVVRANDWQRDENAAQAKAREVGIVARPGESMEAFMARLRRAVDERARV